MITIVDTTRPKARIVAAPLKLRYFSPVTARSRPTAPPLSKIPPSRFTFPNPKEREPLTARNRPVQEAIFTPVKDGSEDRKSFTAKRIRTKGHRKPVSPKIWKTRSAR